MKRMMKAVTVMTTTTLYKIIESELHSRTNTNEIIDENGNLVFFDNDHQIMPKILHFDDDTKDIVNDLFGGFSLEDAGHDHHFKKTFALRFMNRQINRQTVEAFKMQLISTFLTSESYINRVYADLEKYLEQTGTSEGTTKNLSKEISNQINEQLNNQLDKRESMENTRQNNEEDTREDSTQNVEGTTTTDDRQAHAELPQNNVNLDVDSTRMDSADTNDISRNKQSNNQETETETTGHREGLTTGENSRDETGEMTSETKGTTDSVSDSEREGETHTVTKSFQLDELFKTNGVLEGIFRQFDKKCFLQIW